MNEDKMRKEERSNNDKLDNTETEIKSLRKDFDILKKEFEEKGKVDKKAFEEFEKRVIRMEEHLELSAN